MCGLLAVGFGSGACGAAGVLEQTDVIKKGSAWFEIHTQVEIAVWTSLSPSDGAKHRDPMSPAPPRHAWISARRRRSPSMVST